MELWSRRLTIGPGLLGVAVLTLGALVAIFSYVGATQQAYSPFNHFVSELGDTGESEAAAFFNICLMVGGLLFGIFMIGVGLRFSGVMRYIIAIGGAIVGIFGALVGVYPMDVDLSTHGLVALGFFEGSLVLLLIFSLYISLSRQTAYPRWMALLALPMIISNALFINTVFSAGENALAAPVGERDAFLLITTSEWGVITFLMVWVFVVALWRLRHS